MITELYLAINHILTTIKSQIDQNCEHISIFSQNSTLIILTILPLLYRPSILMVPSWQLHLISL